MSRIAAGAALIAGALLLGACGDEGETPALPDAADRAEIAATINAVRSAWAKADGEAICARLSERGQRITVRVVRRDLARIEVASCAEAIEALASRVNSGDLKKVLDRREFRAAEVDVDPSDDPGFNETTDTVDIERASRSVAVSCHDNSGNSLFAVSEDEGWKLMLPFCTGR